MLRAFPTVSFSCHLFLALTSLTLLLVQNASALLVWETTMRLLGAEQTR